MKYQIILESKLYMPDDEFSDLVGYVLAAQSKMKKFRMVCARSLEGIQEESWKQRDEEVEDLL